ncbi:hypothetical protein VTK26DRAFT_3453 [Humicola hyalothermophila]
MEEFMFGPLDDRIRTNEWQAIWSRFNTQLPIHQRIRGERVNGFKDKLPVQSHAWAPQPWLWSPWLRLSLSLRWRLPRLLIGAASAAPPMVAGAECLIPTSHLPIRGNGADPPLRCLYSGREQKRFNSTLGYVAGKPESCLNWVPGWRRTGVNGEKAIPIVSMCRQHRAA